MAEWLIISINCATQGTNITPRPTHLCGYPHRSRLAYVWWRLLVVASDSEGGTGGGGLRFRDLRSGTISNKSATNTATPSPSSIRCDISPPSRRVLSTRRTLTTFVSLMVRTWKNRGKRTHTPTSHALGFQKSKTRGSMPSTKTHFGSGLFQVSVGQGYLGPAARESKMDQESLLPEDTDIEDNSRSPMLRNGNISFKPQLACNITGLILLVLLSLCSTLTILALDRASHGRPLWGSTEWTLAYNEFFSL